RPAAGAPRRGRLAAPPARGGGGGERAQRGDPGRSPGRARLLVGAAVPQPVGAALAGGGDPGDGATGSLHGLPPDPHALPGLPVRGGVVGRRSEQHTSELQSRENLVCRLLLEKKKTSASPRHQLLPPSRTVSGSR